MMSQRGGPKDEDDITIKGSPRPPKRLTSFVDNPYKFTVFKPSLLTEVFLVDSVKAGPCLLRVLIAWCRQDTAATAGQGQLGYRAENEVI